MAALASVRTSSWFCDWTSLICVSEIVHVTGAPTRVRSGNAAGRRVSPGEGGTDQHQTSENNLDKYLYQVIYIVPMIESRIQSFPPIKTQWFHIMLSLPGEEQHGYGIMQEVLQRTTGKVRL